MKNSVLRKYTIVLLVCFFALLVKVNAAESVIDDQYLTYNRQFVIGDGSFVGFTCSVVNSGHSQYVTINNNRGGGSSVVTYTKTTTDITKLPIRCTWSGRNKMGENKAGSALYNFNLENDPNRFYDSAQPSMGSFTIALNTESGVKVTSDVYGYIAGFNSTISIDSIKPGTGMEYIKFENDTCKGNKCVIYPSSEVDKLAGANSIQAKFTIVYILNNQKYEVGVIVNINTTNSTKIFPGTYGVCQMSGDWTPGTYKNSTFYKSTKSGSILPSCDASKTNSPVQFKGWTKTVTGQLNLGVSDHCYNVAAAGTVAETNATYTACYESIPNVIIYFHKGTLNSSGWTRVANTTNTYYAMGNGSVALPTIDVEGFLGWRKNDLNGEFVKAGTPVPYDGSRYYAEIENKIFYRDTNKAVRQNGTVALKVKGMTGCTSSDSNVAVNYIQGECQVTGINVSDTRSNVLVTFDNGQTVTYSFMVIPQIDDKDNSEFLIDTTPNIHYGENWYGEDGGSAGGSGAGGDAEFIGDICKNLELQWGGSTSSESKLFGGYVSESPTGIIRSSSYRTRSTCSGDTKEYLSLCLDPGRHGPDDTAHWYPYKVQENDLKNSTGYLKKILTYIVKLKGDSLGTLIIDNENNEKIAIHHAVRMAAIMDGVDGGPGAFARRHAFYATTAHAVAACGSDRTCITTAINTKFTNYYDMTGADRAAIVGYMTDYFASAQAVEVSTTGVDKKLENGQTSKEGNASVYTVDITFTLPGTVTTVTFVPEPTCNGSNAFGISCETPVLKGTGTGEGGTKTYTYSVKMRKTGNSGLPENDAQKKLVSFKLSYNGSGMENLYIATSTQHNDWQRMLVINRGDSNLNVYIPFKLDCNTYDLSTYNPDNPSSFPAEEFVAAGCCAFVTDEAANEEFMNKVCSQECTTSTLASVCSFTPTAGKVDLYTIKEGHKAGDPQIGTCVVNAHEKYQVTPATNFVRHDDAGNLYNVKDELDVEGSKNHFCTVTCREEWTIAMEAFGNYVGKRAIAAGTYFKVQTDEMFMGGKRECYSTFLDYKYFTEKMGKLSDKVVEEYDSYSENSHIYTDIKYQYEQKEPRTTKKDYSDSGCIKRKTCPESYSSSNGKDPYTCGDICCIQIEVPNSCGSGVTDCGTHWEESELGEATCEKYGSVHGYNVKTNKYVDSEERDLVYTTKKETTTENNDNTETTKTLMGDNDGKMVNKYNANKSMKCTGNWVKAPGATAPNASCDSYGGFKNFCDGGYVQGNYCDQNDSGDSQSTLDSAFEPIRKWLMETYDAKTQAAKGRLVQARDEVYKYAEMFYKCQHFEVTNKYGSQSRAEYQGWAENNPHKISQYILGDSKDYAQIENRYQPGATYTYDDEAYMTLLGEDNYVVPYIEKNETIISGYTGATNTRATATIHNVNNGGGASNQDVYLSRNYLETTFYHTLDPWEKDSDETNKYDNGTGSVYAKGETSGLTPKEGIITLCHVDPGTSPKFPSPSEEYKLTEKLNPVEAGDSEWFSGSCFKVVLYYKDINYVRTSIDNSSFYKNKGDWFFSNSSGMYVAHGDNVDDALSKLRSKTTSVSGTSVPVNKDNWYAPALVNVFPVSYSTPRNLYTYTYEFGDMGYFSDTKKLGRILGGQKAIIKENKRTCFYEVYEEVCLCCGSEDYNYTSGENETVRDAMASQMGYGVSNQNEIKNNKKGTLAISPSSVQLSDLNSDSNRDLASNWGTSPFYYDGILYSTSKGAEVLKAIESRGETIYEPYSNTNSGLEYSYILTPSTIASIREYNDTYGYEVTYNRVSIYGRYKSGEKDTKLDVNDAGTISFVHYGSLFLESYLPADAKVTALTDFGDKVCYVDSSGVNADNLRKKVTDEGCRWVDYVTAPNSYLGEDLSYLLNPPSYLRMAFK